MDFKIESRTHARSVDKLPDSFPMQRISTQRHNNDQYRHVLFIDMPDFDSVESSNRELVDLWLPHLDVVMYVVSPERYRDDQGWRLLIEHAQQHAWVFIMNHWDRGDPAQLEDFRSQLTGAGLTDPIIYRTDSSDRTHANLATEDEFADLQNTLIALSDQAIVDSLNELGILARLRSIKSVSDHWLSALGDEHTLSELPAVWRSFWHESSDRLRLSLSHKSQRIAQLYADSEVSWLSRLLGGRASANQPLASPSLLDEAVLQRLDSNLEDFLNQQSQSSQIALAALRQSVAQPYADARQGLASLVDDELEKSLAQPGSRWQRQLHKHLGLLCLLLPLASIGWIAWRVVQGFVEGGSNPAAYLGSNFAVNGALLLAISWVIPALVRRLIRPSREKAALRGVSRGLDAALTQVEGVIAERLAALSTDAQALRSDYQQLWQRLAQPDHSSLPEQVQRMLANEIVQPDQRSIDVRASTHNSTFAAPLS